MVDEKVYEMFRDYMKNEDNLLNHRLTWLLTIHGFLYATCGFTLQMRVEVVQRIASDFKGLVCQTQQLPRLAGKLGQGIPHDKMDAALCKLLPRSVEQAYFGFAKLGFTMLEIDMFLAMLAFIGLAVSFIGLFSIWAAKGAARNVEAIFRTQYFGNNIYSDRVGSRDVSLVRVKVNTGQAILPMIAGGGSWRYERWGFAAPLVIPIVLIIGWYSAIGIGLYYYWKNWDFVYNVLLG
jgi:hypothetical protein